MARDAGTRERGGKFIQRASRRVADIHAEIPDTVCVLTSDPVGIPVTGKNCARCKGTGTDFPPVGVTCHNYEVDNDARSSPSGQARRARTLFPAAAGA